MTFATSITSQLSLGCAFLVASMLSNGQLQAVEPVVQQLPISSGPESREAGISTKGVDQPIGTEARSHKYDASYDCWYSISSLIHTLSTEGKVLVVTDIDETLIERVNGQVLLIQKGLGNILQLLKANENVDLIALTARKAKASTVEKTQRDLSNLGAYISEDDSHVAYKAQLQNTISRLGSAGKPLAFRDGIIYGARHRETSKGKILKAFLEQLPDDAYKIVVFIDDKNENCDSVLRRLNNLVKILYSIRFTVHPQHCVNCDIIPPSDLANAPNEKPCRKRKKNGSDTAFSL